VNSPVPVPDKVDGFVTTTFCAPADAAGVVQDTDVADPSTTDVHGAPPTVTVAPDTNPVPVIVIDVPPDVEPTDGATPVTVGGATNVNSPVPVPANPDKFVTTMFWTPADPAGVVQVRDVPDPTTTDVHAAPPTVTVAIDTKAVPVIVIDVPPAVEPDTGDTDETTGEATLDVAMPFQGFVHPLADDGTEIEDREAAG